MKEHRMKITGSIIKIMTIILLSSFINIAQDSTHLTPLITDFRVNENAGPVGTRQLHPSVSKGPNGSYVIIWTDERNGYDLFAQLYSIDGMPIGNNIKVNEKTISPGMWAFSISSDVAVNKNGYFMITWRHNDTLTNTYAQLYSNNGIPIGNNFIVNNNFGEGGRPKVIADITGNFIITWKAYNENGQQLLTQKFTSDGNPLGGNVKLSFEEFFQYSINKNGELIIIWNDSTNTWGQWFSLSGIALDSSFIIDINWDDIYVQPIPIGDNDFLLAWDSAGTVYSKIFSSYGTVLSENISVNNAGYATSPDVSSDLDGNYVITWRDWNESTENSLANIYAQRYLNDGSQLGDNFRVNSETEHEFNLWYSTSSKISLDEVGGFVITWMSIRDKEFDIYAQQYSSGGIALDSNFIVNDDEGSSAQWESSISVDGDGNFIITWVDNRNSHTNHDIYVQRFSNDGTAIGKNIKVNNNNAGEFPQSAPIVATGKKGNFIILWHNYETEIGLNIFFQIYSNDGTALGSNVQVNEVNGSASGQYFIDSDKDGNFVITWMNSNEVLFRRYSSDGIALDQSQKVNDSNNISLSDLSISMHQNGNFIITWANYGDVYFQQFSNKGVALGNNIKLENNDDSNKHTPNISIDSSGNFVIVWLEHEDKYDHIDNLIYAQRFSSDGIASGNKFKVSEYEIAPSSGSIAHDPQLPGISLDNNGDFIISWIDYKNDNYNLFAQRYLYNGDTLGSAFKISSCGHSPEVKLWNGKIYSTWSESRGNGTGIDIWANVLDGDFPPPTDVAENQPLPTSFSLAQNYPNPFNPSTIIKYSIPSSSVISNPQRGERSHNSKMEISPSGRNDISHVTLKVYDILGRELATLVNQKQKPGNYEVIWDANNQPSGVYFYQLTAGASTGSASGFVETKKMILVR